MHNAPGSLSQAKYSCTPYQDCSWEIIGESKPSLEFCPLQLEVLSAAKAASDPMFTDFGGGISHEGSRRWHLPEHLAQGAGEAGEAAKQREEQIARARRQELEQVRAEALEQGRQAALLEAKQQFEQSMLHMQASLSAVLEDMQAQLKQNLAELERRSLELSLAIARKLLDNAVEINPEYVQSVIVQALHHAGGAQIKRVRVSRQDLEFIEVTGLARRLNEFDGSWRFEADDALHSGCVVETSAGEVDFQLDKAWERIKDEVMKVTSGNGS